MPAATLLVHEMKFASLSLFAELNMSLETRFKAGAVVWGWKFDVPSQRAHGHYFNPSNQPDLFFENLMLLALRQVWNHYL